MADDFLKLIRYATPDSSGSIIFLLFWGIVFVLAMKIKDGSLGYRQWLILIFVLAIIVSLFFLYAHADSNKNSNSTPLKTGKDTNSDKRKGTTVPPPIKPNLNQCINKNFIPRDFGFNPNNVKHVYVGSIEYFEINGGGAWVLCLKENQKITVELIDDDKKLIFKFKENTIILLSNE